MCIVEVIKSLTFLGTVLSLLDLHPGEPFDEFVQPKTKKTCLPFKRFFLSKNIRQQNEEVSIKQLRDQNFHSKSTKYCNLRIKINIFPNSDLK